MKILITGGAGYVGSACLRYVAGKGHDVLAYDNLAMGHGAAVDGHPLVEGDLADTAHLTATLKEFGADAVMHFAAASYVGESVENPEYYYRNNVGGTLSLLNAMRQAGTERLLFSSTCATYGMASSEPMAETTLQDPLSPYGRTKMAVEWMIRDFAHAYGLGFTLLRYFNASGADGDGRHGEDHTPESHLIPLVLQVALGQRDQINVFGTDYPTPDGTCIRDYVHVQDLASAHLLAIEATEPGTGEVFNIGTGQGHSVLEVIQACEAVTGKPIAQHLTDRRPGDPPQLVADPNKLKTALSWAPVYPDIKQIIETAWAWHSAHPYGYVRDREQS